MTTRTKSSASGKPFPGEPGSGDPGLGRPAPVVGSGTTILVAALGVALAGALVWACVVEVPETVAGKGLLLPASGVDSADTVAGGRILSLHKAVGDKVQPGDVIARLDSSDFDETLKSARTHHAGLVQRLQLLKVQQSEEHVRRIASDRQRRSRYTADIDILENLIRELRARQADTALLVRKGLSPRSNQLDVDSRIASAIRDRDTLAASLKALDLETAQARNADVIKLSQLQSDVDDAARRIKEIEAKIADAETIRAPRGGTLLLLPVAVGDVVPAGKAVATIANIDAETGSGKGSGIVGFLYVPVMQGAAVRTGIDVRVTPASVKRADFGFIPGKVAAVSKLPVDRNSTMRWLRNEKLVDDLLAGGAPLEIKVDLRYKKSDGGFVWYSSRGTWFKVAPGMALDADFVVRRTPLISLVLPFMRRFFPSRA